MMALQRIHVYDNCGDEIAKYTSYPQYNADWRSWVEDDDSIPCATWHEGSWQVDSEMLRIDGETYFVRILTEIV